MSVPIEIVRTVEIEPSGFLTLGRRFLNNNTDIIDDRIDAAAFKALIERQIAVLSPDKMAQLTGHGITAIVEITLDRQDATSLDAFEQRVAGDSGVQQCYRVSPGPDFCLVVHARDMPAYQSLTQRLFTSDANVRNIKAYFSIKRSKFGAELPIPR